MKTIKKLLTLGAAGSAALLCSQATGSTIIGGDAANQASANSVLDIVFAIDTSGSMNDDIAAIGGIAQRVIRDLVCPDSVVRARFMGLTSTSGSVFNEHVRG